MQEVEGAGREIVPGKVLGVEEVTLKPRRWEMTEQKPVKPNHLGHMRLDAADLTAEAAGKLPCSEDHQEQRPVPQEHPDAPRRQPKDEKEDDHAIGVRDIRK